MQTCEFCGRPATRTAWYGDENSRFGGGQIPLDLCDSCPEPCNHHADPHAGYTHETRPARAVQSVGRY